MTVNLLYDTPSQRVVLTLSESCCGCTGPFVLGFVNELTGATASATVTDVSTGPGRYNEFLITTTGPTGSSGVYLQAGQHTYTASDLLGNVLETGRVWVEGPAEVLPEFDEPTPVTPTFDD